MERHIEKIFFTITNVCNNKCSYCFQEKQKVNKYIEIDSFNKIIKQLDEIGITKLTLSGGEASLHPKFHEILDILGQYKFEVSLFSNGLINNEIINAINNSTIKKIYLSLDGSEDKYNYSRGKATIQTIEKSIQALNKNIVIMNTLNSKNYLNVRDFLEYCSSFPKIKKINFNPIKILHESYADLALTSNMLQEANKQINNFTTNNRNNKLTVRSYYNCYSNSVMNCGAARNSISIDLNGDVSGCIFGSSVDKETFVVGNLLEENLMDMWNDSKRWGIFTRNKDSQCNTCKDSQRCTGTCTIEKYLINKSMQDTGYLCYMRWF